MSLTLLVGKGGVGRSTVAAALARCAAQAGQRTALIEVDTPTLHAHFGTAPGAFTGEPVVKNLTLFHLTAREAFGAYATKRLGSSTLYRTLFDNRFVHYFLDAIPGLSALLILGRIFELAEHGDWDRLFVDLPATGHGLGFLRVPRLVTQSVPHGPLYDQAIAMQRGLEDHAQTGVILVTLAEPLPVNETLETAPIITDDLRMALTMTIANRRMTPPIPATLASQWSAFTSRHHDDPAWHDGIAYTKFLEQRFALHASEYARLQSCFGKTLFDLPVCAGDTPQAITTQLAACCQEWNV